MSGGQGEGDGGGCIAIFVVLLVIAAVVAALVSLAAIIDPFSWMPTAAEMWEDCSDDYATDRDECAWSNRFPGFWLHAIVNLLYIAASAAAVLLFWWAAADTRASRIARYSSAEASEAYEVNRIGMVAAGAWVAALAVPPLAVGIL
jgi:NADH:ubiquinone oxidoreductase subunit 3 (subunit A)